MERYYDRAEAQGEGACELDLDSMLAYDVDASGSDAGEVKAVRSTLSDDGFAEAFDGDHSIEYWFWNGTRLIPASPDEAERLRERAAWERIEAWREAEQQRMRRARLRALWVRALDPLHACRAAVSRVLHLGRALGDEQVR
jgi:hypothetical protein